MGCIPSKASSDSKASKSKNNGQTGHSSRWMSCSGNGYQKIHAPPHFTEFSLAELRSATNNFSPEYILSEAGEKTLNIVYKGRLHNQINGSWITVKRCARTVWSDKNLFTEKAFSVGKLRHKRVANLIGFCCDEDERLLVAEYIPNGSLAKQLFSGENQPLDWALRLRIALYIAEALDYCRSEGFPLYHDLNAYRILFDEGGEPRLSCFGLIRHSWDGRFYSANLSYAPPEYIKNGIVTATSVIFSFGIILLNLLSGEQVPPSHVLDNINGKSIVDLMDSRLDGKFSIDEATAVFELASTCLSHDPNERPSTKDLISSLAALQKKAVSYAMLGIQKSKESFHAPQKLSPLGDACSRADLTAIHHILVSTNYKEDDGSNEFSFQEWTQQMKDTLDIRKRGDAAFCNKNFKLAINQFTQFMEVGTTISPMVYIRRSLCYLLLDQPEAALRDAMQAQCTDPDFAAAYYIQAVALFKLDMHTDAADMLKEAAALEQEKPTT